MNEQRTVVLVTGSSSGFGRLIAQTLAQRGHVVFAGLRGAAGKNAAAAAQLKDLAARTGTALDVVDLDVTDDQSVARALRQVRATAGRLDVVVNNAGVVYTGPLEAFTIDQARAQFETNVFGVLRVNRAALPLMRAQGSGLLIQIGSLLGRMAFPFVGLYAGTKFALEGITEAYRLELAPLGIDAVIVEPGTYPTQLGANGTEPSDAPLIAPYAPALARMRTVLAAATAGNGEAAPDPQEVADAVAALIAQPMGQRPLRTIVAIDAQRQGPQAINGVAEQVITATLKSLGFIGAA